MSVCVALRFVAKFACLFLITLSPLDAQQAISLPSPRVPSEAVAQAFAFVSDAPAGPGWSRPDEIARVYFPTRLPAFFSRTISLDDAVPQRGRLSWIFTGPHGGFTVQLTASKIRLFQRYYDSTGLYSGQGNFPEKVTRDDERQVDGPVRTLTVVADSHLSIHVLVNGQEVLVQSCVLDVVHHQLMLSASRSEHQVVRGALLATTTDQAHVSVHPQERHQEMLGFGGSPSIPAQQ